VDEASRNKLLHNYAKYKPLGSKEIP